MESPQTSQKKVNEGDTVSSKVNSTPKNCKNCSVSGEEFSLYNLHRESSPNFRAGQDVLEVGWGDSPEPLNVEKKFQLNGTPVNCKKKLETKESPKSSVPFKKRNIRTGFSLPSKSVVDIAKYVAEVQELSKNIMKEFNAQNDEKDLFEDDTVLPNIQLTETSSKSRSSSAGAFSSESSSTNSHCNSEKRDSEFDNVLESFINEEDDWLSQALLFQEQVKTPLKGSFVKSKSENELTIPQSVNSEKKSVAQNCRNINNNFRRTSSFDLTKPPNSCNVNHVNSGDENKSKSSSNNQYSLQEIERKRLEAMYRKERKEIERRKLEALKKLEMKKLRVIKTKSSVIELVNKIV